MTAVDLKVWDSLSRDVSGFTELKTVLGDLPNQTIGLPCAFCETGEEYVEFSISALARPDDLSVIEKRVANEFKKNLRSYLCSKGGRIYWRIPFECDICDAPQVDRYDDSGPDVEFGTNRRCFTDKKWKAVKAYCRVYRASNFVPFDDFRQMKTER